MKSFSIWFFTVALAAAVALPLAGQVRPVGPAGAKPAAPRDVLPAITMGKWTGHYAYYEHPLFDLVVGTNGFVTIYLKDRGQPVGAPVAVERSILYIRDTTGLGESRRVISFDDPPPPGLIRGSLVFRGSAEDNARFETRITVDKNTVGLSMKYDEPKDLTYSATLGYGWRMPPTHSFPEGTDPNKIERALQGYSLEIQADKGPPSKLSYIESTTLVTNVEYAVISGPWGPRRLTLRQKDCRLHLVNYPYMPLYVGYSFGKYVRPGFKDEPLQFTIE